MEYFRQEKHELRQLINALISINSAKLQILISDVKIPLIYLSYIIYYQILAALLKYLLPNLQAFICTAPKDILPNYLPLPTLLNILGWFHIA